MNRIKKSTYIFYGIGVAYFMLDQIFNQWVQYFFLPSENIITQYNLTPLIMAEYLTKAFIIMRLVDAIADPLVGYLSDHCKFKIGRRSFFMLIGNIPLMLAMIAFFYPLGGSNFTVMLYLSLIGSLYFISYTLVGGPYNALIPDIAETKEERLNLSTVQSVFRLIFTAIPFILSPILVSYLVRNYNLGYRDSIRYVVIGFAIISAILVFVSIFGIQESKISKISNAKTVNFKEYLKYLKSRDIVIYFIGFMFFFAGFNIIRNSIIYYVTLVLNQPEGKAAIPIAILFISSALFFPVTKRLSSKFNYRKVMLVDLILIVFGLIGIIMGNANQIIFYIMIFIIGAGVSGAAFIFPPSMLSEISHNIYVKNNVSVEGMMFGIQGLFLKLAFLLSIVVSTSILPLRTINGGATKFGLMITLILAIIFLIISFICYYINKQDI